MTSLTVEHIVDRHEVIMYAKLYSTILRSSIWLEDAETRLLWITMLAAADEKGYVFGSPAGMAHTARISPEGAKKALERLSRPDSDSSDLSENPENEGRRIEQVAGGWRIINYIRYRSIRDSDERREYNRLAKRKERMSAKVSQRQPGSADVRPSESEADTESDTETKSKGERARFAPPTLEEAKNFFESEHLGGNAEAFFYHFSESEWRKGNGKPVRNWQLTARKWGANETRYASGKPSAKHETPVVANLTGSHHLTPEQMYAGVKAPTDEELAEWKRQAEAEVERMYPRGPR